MVNIFRFCLVLNICPPKRKCGDSTQFLLGRWIVSFNVGVLVSENGDVIVDFDSVKVFLLIIKCVWADSEITAVYAWIRKWIPTFAFQALTLVYFEVYIVKYTIRKFGGYAIMN